MTARKARAVGLAALALTLYALLWVGFRAAVALAARHRTNLPSTDRTPSASRTPAGSGSGICSATSGPVTFRLVALIVIVVALARRNLRAAMFLVISVELSGLVTEAAKTAAHRARPHEAFVSASSMSFPSGHALGVMSACWPCRLSCCRSCGLGCEAC
jgi:undecaprenyl-diphosphatase